MALVISDGQLTASLFPSVPRPVGGSVSLYGGTWSDYGALYRTQPNLRTVVHFLARNHAQLKIRAFLRDGQDREQLPFDDPLTLFLRRPNDYTTRHGWVLALIADLCVFDSYLAWKVQIGGRLQALRIPPGSAAPVTGGWLQPQGWRLASGRILTPAEVIYVHGYDPASNMGGSSPVDALRQILAEDAAAGAWREQYWDQSARMAGVIERPADAPLWSPEARNRFLRDFNATTTGPTLTAGEAALLEDGMTWKPGSFSAKDSEYLGARRLSREEVAAAYHVSPLFVGILENANFSNVAEQHKHLYQDTMGPTLDQLEEELERQIVDPEFPAYAGGRVFLEHNLDEKLKGTFEEQATVLQTMVGGPVLTRNEGRRRLNLAPVDGGDEIITPLNVTAGGQASPTDSAPPPTPGSAARFLAAGLDLEDLVDALGEPEAIPAATGRKSLDNLDGSRGAWAHAHRAALAEFFGRQAGSVRPKIGAGSTPTAAFDTPRWNRELAAVLLPLAVGLASHVGGTTAARFGGAFNLDTARPWLEANVAGAAAGVNAATLGQLVDLTGSSTEILAGVGDVFDRAAGSRADEIATTRTTELTAFSAQEGASQAGMGGKVWVAPSNSPASRHASMNGETVPMGDTFSNGLRWPGDSEGGVDETAGCECYLDFSSEGG